MQEYLYWNLGQRTFMLGVSLEQIPANQSPWPVSYNFYCNGSTQSYSTNRLQRWGMCFLQQNGPDFGLNSVWWILVFWLSWTFSVLHLFLFDSRCATYKHKWFCRKVSCVSPPRWIQLYGSDKTFRSIPLLLFLINHQVSFLLTLWIFIYKFQDNILFR